MTGPRGPRPDAVQVLEQLSRRQFNLGPLRLGVAFNACLPTEQQRTEEQQRLVRKLKTGLVREVWLNCGDDVQLLDSGIAFVRATAASLLPASQVLLFGSVLLPNSAQLQQMNERPWNGVHFSQQFLGSLAGMECCTQNVLELYGRKGVEPIVESKVRSTDDLSRLEFLLRPLADVRPSVEDAGNMPLAETDMTHSTDVQSNTYYHASRRRWGPGRPAVTVAEQAAAGGRQEPNSK